MVIYLSLTLTKVCDVEQDHSNLLDGGDDDVPSCRLGIVCVEKSRQLLHKICLSAAKRNVMEIRL